MLDPGGTIIDWNRACSELSGVERDEARGQRLVDLLGEEGTHVKRLLERLSSERQPIRFESRWVVATGACRTLAFAGSVVRDDEARATRLLLTGVDVTEAVVERAAREADLQMLIDLAPAGIFVADLDGHFTYVNAAGCRLLGYTEVVGKTITDLIPPEDASRLWRVRDQLMEGGVDVADRMVRRKDGTYVSLEVSTTQFNRRLLAFVRESKADLSRAQAIAGVGSWRLDVEQDEILGSDQAHAILGTPPGTPLTFEQFLDHVHPDDRTYVTERYRAALRGEPYDIEHRIIVGDHVKWVRERADLERGPEGRVIAGIGVIQDITERRRHADDLRLREERLRVALQASPAYVVNQDLDLRYTWIYHPIAPLTPESVVGKTDFDLLPHDEATHITRIKRGVLETGTGARSIVAATVGSVQYALDLIVEPLRDATGRIVGITCAAWDVTEQQREEKRQRFLARAAAVLINAGHDSDSALSQLAELAVADLAEWFLVDVIESGHARRIKVAAADPGKRVLAETLQQQGERLDRHLPHLMFESLYAQRPVLLPEISPEQLGALAQGPEQLRVMRALEARSLMTVPLVARDQLLGAIALISSQPCRKYDDWDLSLAEDLARVAAVAIGNAQLYQSAQHAIAARDEILGIVAHDLRNLLSAILLHLQLLGRRDAESGPVSQRPLEAIQRAAKRMSRLIQDMLDLTSLEAGSLSVEPVPLGVQSMLDEALENQRERAAQAGVEMRLDVVEPLPDVVGDRDRLLQVLDNLVENAIKFTRRGGTVVVGGAREAGGVLFWVADTGSGIPQEHLARVFDRFWRDKDTDRGGAGLGLPIVKGIVETHGGRLWVESELGRGTTFYFTIPAAPAARARASAR